MAAGGAIVVAVVDSVAVVAVVAGAVIDVATVVAVFAVGSVVVPVVVAVSVTPVGLRDRVLYVCSHVVAAVTVYASAERQTALSNVAPCTTHT
jgi:hypothetical protein